MSLTMVALAAGAVLPACTGGSGSATPVQPVRLGAAETMTHACGVAADGSGGLYVVGQTDGPLSGAPRKGRRDLFLARVRPDGAADWIRQLGDPGVGAGTFATGCAVAVGPDGEAYVAGTANGIGSFEGQTLPGVYTGFVARFEADGSRRWLTLVGEAPGPTETMAIAIQAGQLQVLGWTQAPLGGQPARGQGDTFLRRLNLTSGAAVSTLRFGDAREEVPLGLVPRGEALWIGYRTLVRPLEPAVGYHVVKLAGDEVAARVSGVADATFAPEAFSVIGDDAVVVLGTRSEDEQSAYRFQVHRASSAAPAQVTGAAARGLGVRGFVCAARGCAVAGQVIGALNGTPGSGSLDGFVTLFTPDLLLITTRRLHGEDAASFTVASALAPAAGGRWHIAGWTAGALFGLLPIGTMDGYVTEILAAPADRP